MSHLPIQYPQGNLLSKLITKVAGGTADADAARAITAAMQATIDTRKKSSVTVTLTFEPQEERGAVLIRPSVAQKLPRLPQPASQFNMSPTGEALTQLEWMMSSGKDEGERAQEIAGKRPEAAVAPAAGRPAVALAPLAQQAPLAPLAPPPAAVPVDPPAAGAAT